MTVAIIGASGFIGSAVTKLLLETTDYDLVLFSHRASRLHFTVDQEKRLRHVDGSVLQRSDVKRALKNCDSAVYLVHLMGQRASSGFASAEDQAAHVFGKVAQQTIKRLVYVGGMGQADDPKDLTTHLASRQATGTILRSYVEDTVELHTPMVIGKGGAGYDVLTQIVKLSPVLPLPKWANGVTNPITVTDVARYVHAALALPPGKSKSVAIGGPEQLSYVDIAQRYAQLHNKRLRIMPIPLPQKLASAGLRLCNRNAAALTVADMLASAGYNTKLDPRAKQLFPDIKPEKVDSAFVYSNKL